MHDTVPEETLNNSVFCNINAHGRQSASMPSPPDVYETQPHNAIEVHHANLLR
ncbi:MAG: hypothetical protein ACYYK0_07840 [Candidatus Eutrophobiaceae bacterium]